MSWLSAFTDPTVTWLDQEFAVCKPMLWFGMLCSLGSAQPAVVKE